MKLWKRLLLVGVCSASLALYAQEGEHEEHGEEAEHAEERPVGLLWANFALLALGLGFLMAKTLPKAFAARTEAIQKDIKEAQALKADAERRAAEVEARVASLGADIEKFKADSGKEMAHEGERIRKETEAAIQRIGAQATLEIEAAGKIATRELREYSAELALKLAEDRVKARMDAGAEASLVSGFVAELSRQSGPQEKKN